MKRNILVVLTNLPYPLNCGGNQAMFNGIDCIKNDYNVYCVYRGGIKNQYYKEKRILEKMWGNVKIYPYIEKEKLFSPLNFFNHVVFKLKKKMFGSLEVYKSSEMIEFFDIQPAGLYDYVNTLIEELKIDIIQIEMVSRMNIVLGLPKSVKTIFVHHELRYVINELTMSKLPYNSYRQACTNCAKIMEIGTLNQFDAVITLSYIDTDKLKKAGVTTNIYTSFAIVNTKKNGELTSKGDHILTFCGPESHNPNILAVNWFLEHCWNNLLREDNSFIFRIIGKWSEETVRAIRKKYANVEFTGFVENLEEVLKNTISIIPLTVGSGIRMKILEASTIGVPFVSTTIGAEGLPFVNGEDCYITDDPIIFVEDLLALRDNNLRLRFIKSSNNIVNKYYSIEALRKNRIAVYEDLLIKQ